MSTYSGLYNFIADTCILVVVAYLLARGRMLSLLFRESPTPSEVFLLGTDRPAHRAPVKAQSQP